MYQLNGQQFLNLITLRNNMKEIYETLKELNDRLEPSEKNRPPYGQGRNNKRDY